MRRLLQLAAPGSMLLALACSNGQASRPQTEGDVAAPATITAPSVALAGRVTDAAQILNPAQEASLSTKLEQLERRSGHQVIAVTVPTLGGQDVAVFAKNLANSWGIGREDHADGVVLLIAPNERKVRIEVGYGLETTLPDALCQQILDEQVLPRFRQGDLPGGVEAGVDALISRLSSTRPLVMH